MVMVKETLESGVMTPKSGYTEFIKASMEPSVLLSRRNIREAFKHFDTDVDNPRIQPDRFLFIRATLAIP